MKGRVATIPLPLLLVACSDGRPASQVAGPPDLETAAVARGVVPDPGDRNLTGLYARDTDRVCLIARGGSYRLGVFVDYGDGISCTGVGRAARTGNRLTVDLNRRGGGTCSFEARIDGDRILFPPNVPGGCASFCSRRASFAAVQVDRLSGSASEARALRGGDGARLCRD